eukprot:g4806.t1
MEPTDLFHEDSTQTFVKQFEDEMKSPSPTDLVDNMYESPMGSRSDQITEEGELCSFFDNLKTSSDTDWNTVHSDQHQEGSEGVSAAKEWLNFKTKGHQTNNESGPEELISSSYSQIAGSSQTPDASSCKATQGVDTIVMNRHSKEAIRRTLEEEMKKKFTFRPKLVARRKNLSETVGDARIQQLSQPKLPKKLLQYDTEKEAEEAVLLAECSFRPKTGRPPDQKLLPKPVEERLIQCHQHKKLNRARCMLQKEEEALLECTFNPVTNRDKIKLKTYVPLPDRALEIQQNKKEKLFRIKIEEESSFTPAINQRSRRLASLREQKKLEVAAHEGFNHEVAQFESQKLNSRSMFVSLVLSLVLHLAIRNERDCTFVPTINAQSRQLMERLVIPHDFLTRQEYFDEQKRRKQCETQRRLEEEECTFVPRLNNNEDLLAASRFAGRLQEDHEEFVERLARKDPESRATKTDLLKEASLNSCTFKPDMNSISKLIGKRRTVEELYEEGKERLLHHQQDKPEEISPECVFKPTVNRPRRKSSSYKSAGKIPEQIVEEMLRRSELKSAVRHRKRQELKEAELRRELRECTFTPNIKYNVPKSKGPVAIRGIGRYLELQHNAQRLKREKEQRAKKVFNIDPKGSQSKFTIPVPFALSKAPYATSALQTS